MDTDTLRSLARSNNRAVRRQEQAHAALVGAIWEAADEGMAQVDIVAAVGLTRERVRQLCHPGYREKALKRHQEAAR